MTAAALAQAAAPPASLVPLWIIAGYLLLLIALGLVTSRLFRGTAADYFIVSRSVGSFLLLMSIFGTTMTGFALVGSTGKAFTHGIGVYGMLASWSGLLHSACFFLVGIRLWAVGKRYGYMTQCEYFRNRFDSPAVGYVLFPILVLLVIPYLLVGVIASGRFIQTATRGMFPYIAPGGVEPWIGAMVVCLVVLFYVFFGGLRGAVWANTFQTIVFMATGVVAFTMISNKLGGAGAAMQLVLDQPASASRAARAGEIPPLAFLTYLFIPLSVGMFPHLFQHWLTAKSARSFRLTVVAHPIFIAIVWLPCILIGTWAAGLYADGRLVLPMKDGQPIANAVLGAMIAQLVESPVLMGLVAAGVLAAIMSSLDSQFMCIGTMFTHDVVIRLFGRDRFSDHQKVWIGRAFVLGVVFVTYLIAVWLMARGDTHVFDLGVWCFSGFASLFPLALAAVYWRRTTKQGAIACMLTTVAVWSALFVRDVFMDKPPGSEDETLIGGLLPVTYIFAASVVSLVAVSLMTPAPASHTIDRFFDRKADPDALRPIGAARPQPVAGGPRA